MNMILPACLNWDLFEFSLWIFRLLRLGLSLNNARIVSVYTILVHATEIMRASPISWVQSQTKFTRNLLSKGTNAKRSHNTSLWILRLMYAEDSQAHCVRLGSFAWELSLGIFRWQCSFGDCRLAFLAWICSFGICRFGTIAWKLPLNKCIFGSVAWDTALENVRVISFAWDLSRDNFAWDLSLWSLRLKSLPWYESFAWKIPYGIFCSRAFASDLSFVILCLGALA